MATTKDVAQAAGVSITAASYVINGSRTVSETLTKRVLTAMEALDHRSNILARSP
jgi:LacI family transcriptional regulator